MLFDTSAWVEFFDGTEKGEKARSTLSSNTCYTSIISIAELSCICIEKNFNPVEILSQIKSFSSIIDVDEDILLLSGKIRHEKRKSLKNFGLVDAIILSTAKHLGLKVVSCDRHFEGENAIIL